MATDMVIPPPPPPPPPPPCQNTLSKPPPPRPQHAAIPWTPASSDSVEETGDPLQVVHDSQDTEQEVTHPPPPEGTEDVLYDDNDDDDEKINHPVQETEPVTEASGISQGPETVEDGGQDRVLSHMEDCED